MFFMNTSLSQYMHEPYPCFPAIATVMAVHCKSSTAKLKCCSEPFASGSRQIPIAHSSSKAQSVDDESETTITVVFPMQHTHSPKLLNKTPPGQLTRHISPQLEAYLVEPDYYSAPGARQCGSHEPSGARPGARCGGHP